MFLLDKNNEIIFLNRSKKKDKILQQNQIINKIMQVPNKFTISLI
jgi:hypothetical protein